ncbi:MAG: gluconate 2-dehydrogenase subunit 3 family protein [Janthinobacterium lividum]
MTHDTRESPEPPKALEPSASPPDALAPANGAPPGTSPSRRRFLFRSVAAIPAAGALASVSGLASSATASGPAGSTDSASAAQAKTAEPYQPRFFTTDEWAFVRAAVDVLIPSDAQGPGANDLNVPDYIDAQLEGSFGHATNWYMQGPFQPSASPLWGYQGRMLPRDVYRAGIAATNDFCRKQFSGKAFTQLSAAQQDRLFEDMDAGHVQFEQISAQDFFAFLLQNTKEGYLADPMYGGNKDMGSWKMIGFPGARADFLEWVGQDELYPLGPVNVTGKQA